MLPTDHVTRGAGVHYGLSLRSFPTARLRDAHRAGAVDVFDDIDGWYTYVSHADMTLRLRRWLHFKIISALLTVFETMSENGDYANAPYS